MQLVSWGSHYRALSTSSFSYLDIRSSYIAQPTELDTRPILHNCIFTVYSPFLPLLLFRIPPLPLLLFCTPPLPLLCLYPCNCLLRYCFPWMHVGLDCLSCCLNWHPLSLGLHLFLAVSPPAFFCAPFSIHPLQPRSMSTPNLTPPLLPIICLLPKSTIW